MEELDIRENLEKLISELYVIPIEDIADSLNVSVTNDRLNLEALADTPKVVLQQVMMTSISWSEHIASRKALVTYRMEKFKYDLNQRISQEKLDYISSKSGSRGSKSEAETYVDSLDEIKDAKIKLARYTSYIEYMTSLSKQLDMVHYAAKELLKDHERFEKTK